MRLDPSFTSVLEKLWVRRIFLFGVIAASFAVDFSIDRASFFPPWLVIPIALTAWYEGLWAGLILAGGLSMLRLGVWAAWSPSGVDALSLSFFARWASAMAALAFLIARTSQLTREVRVLRGLLPICMHCHRIRGENDQWFKLEAYVSQNSEATFTHGICPKCQKPEANR